MRIDENNLKLIDRRNILCFICAYALYVVVHKGCEHNLTAIEMEKLTPRQKKFADIYIANGGNAMAAAREAGYKQPQVQGKENIQKHRIAEYIKNLTAPTETLRIATAQDRQQFWTRVMLGLEGGDECKMSDRLKASELLGKSQLDFVEKRIIEGDVSMRVSKDRAREIARELLLEHNG